jgi:integrase
MTTRRSRHRNAGLRKRCPCLRKNWPKCPHSWYLNFKPKGGPHHQLSLDAELWRHIDSKAEAQEIADRVRTAIRAGTFRVAPPIVTASAPLALAVTFHQFAKIWQERRGNQLVSAPLDTYRLKTISGFVLPGTDHQLTFGRKSIDAITTDDIEAFRDWRKSRKLSAVAINQDLRLLRKMFNWALRKGYLTHSPFKIGSESAIGLEREIPRNKRLAGPEDEQRLLNAANPRLRGVIIAMLDTACRPGEILSLQWVDVSLTRRELRIRAENEKTRRERIIPISARLLATLEMRKHDPAGRPFGPDAYVFGDALGRRVKSVYGAWVNAAMKAGLKDFQLRDLRHEAGSRFDEAGMPIVYVSTMLGHSNLSTTSRYLNVNRRGLHLAMQKFEESQKTSQQHLAPTPTDPPTEAKSESVVHPLYKGAGSSLASVQDAPPSTPSTLVKQTLQ